MDGDSIVIESLQARAIRVPLQRPLRTAAGNIPAAPLVLIDIGLSDAPAGRAYIFAYTPLMLKPLVELLEGLVPLLRGKTLDPRTRMREFESTFRLLGRQGLLGMAIAGLDMALWDGLARAQGLPVVSLLGGEAKPIPAYDSFGLVDPSRDQSLIEESLDRGFKAIKIKLGEAGLDRDLQVTAAVRSMIGAGVRLMVDFNQTLDVSEAIRRIDALAKFDLAWVEEPVPAEDLLAHAKVRQAVSVPIQTGENWWFADDMAKAIALQACDLSMPDLMKIGGITGWTEAMALAEAAALPVSSHIFVEASAHVLAVTPTAHWLEFLDKARPILTDPATLEDGAVTAKGPGLGLDWDEEAVARFCV